MVEGYRFSGAWNYYRICIDRKRRNRICIARRGYFWICDLVVLLSRYLFEGDSNLRLCLIHAAFRRAPHAKLGHATRSARMVPHGTANNDSDLSTLPARVAVPLRRLAYLVDIEFRGDQQISVRSWSTGLIVVAAIFSWGQGYKRLEKTQMIIVGLLLICILTAAIACQPHLGKLVSGLFIPIIPEYKDWIHTVYPKIAAKSAWIEIVSYIGIIGGGLPTYIGYFSFLREKRWGLFENQAVYRNSSESGFTSIDTDESNLTKGKTWLKAVKADVAGSFLAVFIFSAAFMVLGSVILHEGQQIPDNLDLLSHQESFLTSLHPSLLVLYRIGIFTAIGGTLFATFDVWTKTVYEGLIPFFKTEKSLDSAKLKRF